MLDGLLTPTRSRTPMRREPLVDPVDAIRSELERMFGRGALALGLEDATAGEMTLAPRIDAHESDERYLITADLPGLGPDDVEVRIDDGALVIEAARNQPIDTDSAPQYAQPNSGWLVRERLLSRFKRVLPLPSDIDESGIKASVNNGLLSVHLPRVETARPRGKPIPISG